MRRRLLAGVSAMSLPLCSAIAFCGCGTHSGNRAYVTEQQARLIGLARDAVTARGFSLKDAIYEVRPDADGWVVQIDKAPGYHGSGEPSIVLDATVFVKFDGKGAVTGIVSQAPTTRPPAAPAGSER